MTKHLSISGYRFRAVTSRQSDAVNKKHLNREQARSGYKSGEHSDTKASSKTDSKSWQVPPNNCAIVRGRNVGWTNIENSERVLGDHR